MSESVSQPTPRSDAAAPSPVGRAVQTFSILVILLGASTVGILALKYVFDQRILSDIIGGGVGNARALVAKGEVAEAESTLARLAGSVMR